MKNLLILLLIPMSLLGQKYQYNGVDLMTAEGKIIQRWDADSYVTQVGDDLTVASTDKRLLQTICTAALFDVSPYRNYKLISATDTIFNDRGIDQRMRVSKYIGLVYYDKLTVLYDTDKKYMILVPENNIGIVIYEKNKNE